MSMTGVRKEEEALVKVPCIHYLIQFKKNINDIKALLDLGSKVNIMTTVYAS